MKDVFWSQQKMVAQALLIKRLGAEAKGAELLSWQKVTWRNGALGCPKPGVSYTQQLINGVTMNWQLHGQVYVLHGNDKGGLFLCNRQPEKPYRIGWQGSEIIVE